MRLSIGDIALGGRFAGTTAEVRRVEPFGYLSDGR